MISFASSASNMENDIEKARASNMEEDKASSPNKEKIIDEGNASNIEITNILETLYTKVRQMPSQQNGSESRRSECCIYRVPNQLRNVYSKAYDPNLISIGPLHRENKRLEDMEKEKLEYFKKLTEQDGMDEKMFGIVSSIKKQEERLRLCYSVFIESTDFVEMILLDAVFIIQFFLESNGDKKFEPRMTFDMREDLMLLENQIPLFIIQDIYDRVYPRSQDVKAIPFLDLATLYFGKYSFLEKVETSLGVKGETSPDVEKETSPGVKGSRHFTDLLRNLMLSRAIQRIYSSDPVKLEYSVVMLRKAGVRFQVSRDICLVNITFDKGVLEIPRLEVDHNFERLVRNIMAMEHCCYSSKAYICSYMKFMDHLIHSEEDVGLLVRKGIIVHRLGDDAVVANMINNLCENIGDNHTCFGDISQELNTHYGYVWNHVKYIYFRNMWRGTGTITGAILMILTFIQTISSVKSLL